MKQFIFNPKTIFVVILILILGTGVYLLLSTPSAGIKDGSTSSRGFLSFFGDRKTRPDDEQVVPGVNTSTAGQSTVGLTSGEDTGTTGQSTAGGEIGTGGTGTTGGAITGGGQGSFSINSIGSNGSQIGSTTGGGSGNSGTGIGVTGGGSGGFTGGQTGGTTGTIPQIDCTPPQLPYTQGEIQALQALTNEFYRISANLHTDVDIQNERDTRKSYYDLYTQTKEYTKQCYAQVTAEMKKSDTDPTKKALESNARWHPYLTDTIIENISKYDGRVGFSTPLTDKGLLEKEIREMISLIVLNDAQVNFLNTLPSLNENQKFILESFVQEKIDLNASIAIKKDQLSKITTPKKLSSSEILGSFFFEESFDGFSLKVARENINYRRIYLWNAVDKWLGDNDGDVWQYYFWPGGNYREHPGQYCQVSGGRASCVQSGFNYNPLVDFLRQSRKKEAWLDTAGQDKSWANPFQWIENGLNVW